MIFSTETERWQWQDDQRVDAERESDEFARFVGPVSELEIAQDKIKRLTLENEVLGIRIEQATHREVLATKALKEALERVKASGAKLALAALDAGLYVPGTENNPMPIIDVPGRQYLSAAVNVLQRALVEIYESQYGEYGDHGLEKIA